jgi:hypothetical protein
LNRLIDRHRLDAPRCNTVHGRLVASIFLLSALGHIASLVVKAVGVKAARDSTLPMAYDMAVRGVSSVETLSYVLWTTFIIISIQLFANNLNRSINYVGRVLR